MRRAPIPAAPKAAISEVQSESLAVRASPPGTLENFLVNETRVMVRVNDLDLNSPRTTAPPLAARQQPTETEMGREA